MMMGFCKNMKTYLKYIAISLAVAALSACEPERLDPDSQIIDSKVEQNDFDKWLYANYVQPYNIDFKYRMEYNESDMNYYLVPAEYEKSIKMAEMLDIPVVGLVENMSYVECPDCGKKIELFGQSRRNEIAAQYNIPRTAALPIDKKLAGGVDKGMIELFNGDWLNELADAIFELQPREHK